MRSCEAAGCGVAVLACAWITTVTEAAGPCDKALAQGTVCETGNERALQLIRSSNLDAITVMQDVGTGSLVVFAASQPEKLDVSTAVLLFSPVKLLVAAIWWDNERAKNLRLANRAQLLTDSIVSWNDDAGRRIASELRNSIGTETFLKYLERYGFPRQSDTTYGRKDETFWAELAPKWKGRLIPARAYHLLGPETSVKDWEDTLSLGEERIVVTALHLSRFLQAVGNRGVMLPPVARDTARLGSTMPAETRVMSEAAALKLQTAMRGTVEHGTAKSAAPILAETGWSMGGKTGTGPGPYAPSLKSDGCFAGLIFDQDGKARFTVATFVKHGGFGGGNAARISAELGRFLSQH
jgi:hypothetical protein